MSDWAVEEFRALRLEEIDMRYARYRLSVLEAEEAMARSLRRYGQMAPIVVCLRDETPVLVDGFKRLAAARSLKGVETLSARRIEVDERNAKAAMYGLNRIGRHFGELEEAWLVQALVREDGLSQVEVATLLGRHKSWVCRRLAMLEKLCGEAQEDLRLGLLSPTTARQLVRLPAGNQQGALETARRSSLSAAELRGVTDLLLASGTQEKATFVLERPREALRAAQAGEVRWRGGQSARRIARELHISRTTVAKVIAEHHEQRVQGAAGLPPPQKRRGSQVDEYEAALQNYLSRYPDMSAVRLLEELRARGYKGGYTVLRQRVKQLRQQCDRPPVERFETGPGAQAQMDWAVYTLDFTQEGRRKVNLFSYVLGYSRRQYLHFTASQDMEATIRGHVRAFEHLQGVAASCLYDNMKVVVARHDGDEPIYNTRFLAFATHYGFRPVACRPRRPQTKGKVERPFYFVETNLLSGREFRSLEHLNEVTAWWLAEVADVRVHRQTRRRPIDMHAEEVPHLIPLPERAYEVAEVVYRTVDVEGFISYAQNRYSVPWHYIGQVLSVRITDEEVTVYDPRLEVLARHRRFPPSEKHCQSRQGEHLPPRDATRRREALQQRFSDLGPLGVRFLEGLLASQRYGWEQAQKVLALSGVYRRDDLLAALERAVRYGAFSANSVERILAVQARPKSILERMADEEPRPWEELFGGDPTPLRPASDYQHLLFEEPEDHDDSKEKDAAGPEDDDGEPCGQSS